MDSFYKDYELKALGFKYIGKEVLVSKRAIFYNHDKIKVNHIKGAVLMLNTDVLANRVAASCYAGILAYLTGLQ